MTLDLHLPENAGVIGIVRLVCHDAITGELRWEREHRNLITDAGDLYHAARIAAGIGPAALAQPASLVTGMKLGIGTTAVSKNGAGAALVSYLAGTNKTIDAGYPTVDNLGAGNGVAVTYQVTFAAGVGTSAALTECVLVTDAATDAASSAANTVSRIVFAATPKGATDVLTIAWSHKQQGS